MAIAVESMNPCNKAGYETFRDSRKGGRHNRHDAGDAAISILVLSGTYCHNSSRKWGDFLR